MKGVILAGGSGTRMRPLTLGTNKHLLPIGEKPMIFYPIEQLREIGIEEILIVTGPEHLSAFAHLLGDGSDLGVSIQFKVQAKPGGIAEALGLSRSFVGGEQFILHLGDNIFQQSLRPLRDLFPLETDAACVVLKEVPDPERFGVAQIQNGKVVDVIEKPQKNIGNLCVTGVYGYTPSVFEVVKELKPSGRGELEISDVNAFYAKAAKLKHHTVEGWWVDAGTLEAYAEAQEIVRGAAS